LDIAVFDVSVPLHLMHPNVFCIQLECIQVCNVYKGDAVKSINKFLK